jgi:peptidoglycan/xylan/chitin deacetylase (PgdA/CDA1 family)
LSLAPGVRGPEPRLPLSIDWEDWYQLCLPGFDDHSKFADRLAIATDLTLELCADLGATGTWFCLGDQAQRHPELVKRIAEAGHRIGVHGLTHTRVFELPRETWRRHLAEARARLQDLSGQAVTGYRAAEWSLRHAAETWWEDLPELGFTFDASRAPLKVLGDPAWPRRPHRLPNGLWELPPPVFGPLPLWGWSLRAFPASWTHAALHRLAAEDAGTPVMLHPWELDEGQPPLPNVPFGHAFAHGTGLRGYGPRLRRALREIRLVPLETWVAEADLSRAC